MKPEVSRHTVSISSFASSPLLWEGQVVVMNTLFSIKPWQLCPRGKASCYNEPSEVTTLSASRVLKSSRAVPSHPTCLQALTSLLSPVSCLSRSGCDLDSLATGLQAPGLDVVCLAHALCTQMIHYTHPAPDCQHSWPGFLPEQESLPGRMWRASHILHWGISISGEASSKEPNDL